MVNEFLDIMDVKNEFLRNVGPEYARSYPPQQLDVALFLLNDFCNNLSGNGLVLFRQAPVQPVQQQYYPQQPNYPPQPAYVESRIPPSPYVQQPYVQPRQPQNYSNPFDEDAQFRQQQYEDRLRAEEFTVQQNINEMNAQLRAPPQPPRQNPMRVSSQPMPRQPIPVQEYIPPQADVNLSNDKPKTFVDKIKEMRTPKKGDKINPEE